MFCVSVGLSVCHCVYIQELLLRRRPPVSCRFRPLSSSFLISFNLQCQQRLTFDCKTTHTDTVCTHTYIHFLSRSYQAAVPRIETLFAVPLQSCQLIKRSQLATYVGNGNKIQPQNEIQSRLRIWIRNWIWNRTRESQCQPWTWTTPHNRWGILGLSVQLS